ncbi:MAG: hypothetical protein WC455_21365 [Dehalococcoidia bacterium]|jgi:hypothetical protein
MTRTKGSRGMNARIMERLCTAYAAARTVGCPVHIQVYPKTDAEYEACKKGTPAGIEYLPPTVNRTQVVWENILITKPHM